MQENEFEKQVRQIIEEFHISPPASVWDKVSRKLNKKRRPRLFPFLFLLIGLAGAGYFIFYAVRHNGQNSEAIIVNKGDNAIKKADSIIVKEASPVTEKISAANEPSLSLKNISSNKKTGVNVLPKLPGAVAIQPKRELPVTASDAVEQQPGSSNNNAQQQADVQALQKNDGNLLDNDTMTNKNAIAAEESERTGNSDTVVTNNDIQLIPNQDSVAAVKNKTVNEPGNTIKSVRQTYKLPNWQWGITAFYGASNAIESLVDLDKAGSASSMAPGNVPGNNDTIVQNSHPYTSSIAYHVGAVVQKKIIKNGFIATGLNFTHLSTKADVSERVNDLLIVQTANNLSNAFTVNEYFQAGSVTYANRYNFIELPVYFQQDILPAKKLSFSYNAGFSVRRLISSKSLIYNQFNDIYFYKDDLLRKTQFQFLTGLNLKINTGSKTSVYIGPQFSYSLSNLYKNENNGKFHFMSYGLQAGLMLHEK